MRRGVGLLLGLAVWAAPLVALGQSTDDESKPAPAARPKPPHGVACVIYGKGTALESSCDDRLTQVSSARFGGRPLARFARGDVDVAWGVYGGRGRGWVHIEDGVFVLDGFSDLSKETFTLLRDVDVVRDHVWLKQAIAVHPLGADPGGVAVRVEAEVDGLADVGLRVPCDSLLFDPAPEVPAADPAAPPRPDPEGTIPRHSSLSIYAEPGGPLLTTLRSRSTDPKEGPLPLPLWAEVVERRDAWTRVRFEIDVARFDVWAPTSQLDADEGYGAGGLGLAGCGGVGHGDRSLGWTIKARTRVVVGALPGTGAPSGLEIEKGARVDIEDRQGPFVAIRTWSSKIYPPEGAKFWVPASVVDGDAGE